MSDIPDWLVELAAQGDEEEEEEAEGGIETEMTPASDAFTFAPEPQTVAEPITYAEIPDEDAAEDDLMDALRGQVEADVAEEEIFEAEEASGPSLSLRIPGLLAWQQLVLTVLLFLDVIVIGLLILVMLGRISIP
jgi:hypothetical protein